MKIKFFATLIFSVALSLLSFLYVNSASAEEAKRISPWKVENVHAEILGEWKLEGYYEDKQLVTNYADKNILWNITNDGISFESDELGKGTTVYNIRRTIYRIFPTMLILTDPQINLMHGKFIVENVNSTQLELTDWNNDVQFYLTRVMPKPKD